MALTFLLAFAAVTSLPQTRSATTGTLRNEYIVVKPDLGGPEYDVFTPSTVVVGQGDSVNMTIRNTDPESFTVKIENVTSVSVQAATNVSNVITPVDTVIPVFTASQPGLLRFYSLSHSELAGYIVILPTSWNTYNPPTTARQFSLLVLPDFAGHSYDVFFPNVAVVNQGDTVNFTIRNTDDMPHGFALPAYNISIAVTPGVDITNGIRPVNSQAPVFTATTPGIFTFICTVYCGPGHIQMVGVLVVLPTNGAKYTPPNGTSYNYLTVIPDYAGNAYDKFLPEIMFANQGDLIYIKVRNTDTGPHGFTLLAYNINNETVAPAYNATVPTDTYITNFVATTPGIYTYFCTIPCGPGHYQMLGYLIVLPKLSGTSPPPTTVTSGISLETAAVVSLGMLVVGFVAGLIILKRFALPR